MRALIIDDESSNRENLSKLLQKYCTDIIITGEAENIEQSLALIKQLQPELIFLDIQLHDQSGFDLLQQVTDINFEIIFVTAYDKYGINAVKFAALDYLLKPIDINELQAAIEKARKKILEKKENKNLIYLLDFLRTDNELPPKIALPLHNETLYISVNDIIRCEADNSYTFFFLNSGERILVSKTLKEYADILSQYHFLRTHQSHLVNLNYVKSWLKEDGGTLLLKDLTKVPVSKPNREKVKDALSHQTAKA